MSFPASVCRHLDAAVSSPASLGDVGMIHHGQGLSFRFEPSDDAARVHAQLDDLESDAALHGLALLGHVHHTAAAFPNLLEEFVAANHRAGLLGRHVRRDDGFGQFGGRLFEKTVCPMVSQQRLNPCAQGRVAPASAVEERFAQGALFFQRL